MQGIWAGIISWIKSGWSVFIMRTIIWILVDVEGVADERILISLHKIWHYTGYQAIQGCIYLIFTFDFLISNQSADDLLLTLPRTAVGGNGSGI